MSGTLVALSHSIRLRPGAHMGAECVLRATYLRRGNRREVGKGEKRPDRVADRDRDIDRGGQRRREKFKKKKKKQGGRSSVRVKERGLI